MKQAYFMYKCRRCGEKFFFPPAVSVSQASTILEKAIVSESVPLVNDGSFMQHIPTRRLHEVHCCGESGYGIADLLGCFIEGKDDEE